MFILIKNLDCFTPAPAGIKDILIAGDKIEKIANPGTLSAFEEHAAVYDCTGQLGFPGIIDQHVHLIGGGGEQGPASRIGEIDLDEILLAGITTVVGVLGFDSFTKSIHSLLGKANMLTAKGITAYIYTGSYAIPTVTITGSVANDLILIEKVIGTGEIAISDYRSSQPEFNQFSQLSAQTHNAGLISGKAGVVHIHVGDGKEGLTPLFTLLERTDLPKSIFVPTHTNRNPQLFQKAMDYCRGGGNIDLTAGEKKGIPVPAAIRSLLDSGMDSSRITISSDANGSSEQGICKIQTLYEDIVNGILQQSISPAQMFGFVTENVAKLLKLYPTKGTLKEGSDADILVACSQYGIQKLFSRGKLMVNDGRVSQSQ